MCSLSVCGISGANWAVLYQIDMAEGTPQEWKILFKLTVDELIDLLYGNIYVEGTDLTLHTVYCKLYSIRLFLVDLE